MAEFNPMTTPKRLPPTGAVLNDILEDIELKKQNNPELRTINDAVNEFRKLMNPILVDIKLLRSDTLMTSEGKTALLAKLNKNLESAELELKRVQARVPAKISGDQLISSPLKEVAQIKDTLASMELNYSKLEKAIRAETRANEESKIKKGA